MSRRRLLRFARLIVACFALVLVRPAVATPAIVDTVVFVANADDTRITRDRSEPSGIPASSVAEAPARALASLQSPRALISDKYLRHCSLLR